MCTKQELVEKDFKYVWHPFTQMKDFENEKPIIIDRGEGVHIYDIEGNKYIDAISSWWVNTLGHSNKRLNKALSAQAEKIEHVLLAGFSHKPAIDLAEALIEITPKELTKVFYSDNGSTAVEVALKMCYQYQSQTGKPNKTKFVALKNSYHGDSLGAVSVGGVDLFHKVYKPLLFDIFQADSPYCYRCPCGEEKNLKNVIASEAKQSTKVSEWIASSALPPRNDGNCNIECLNSMERILEENHEKIAGVIIEPLVQGAGGFIIYPAEYLKRLRTLCDKYDVLLIDDEVAMGFGRTGKMFAFEHADIVPDIVCTAKGLTAGYLPLAATVVKEKIYQGFYDDYDKAKTFYHGHSFTGNPLAAAVAVENIKILKEENIPNSLSPKITTLQNALQKLWELPCVGDVRGVGMIGAVELVKDKTTKEPLERDTMLKIYKESLKQGAILRPMGNVVYFMPPYVITEAEIKKLVEIAYKSIQSNT